MITKISKIQPVLRVFHSIKTMEKLMIKWAAACNKNVRHSRTIIMQLKKKRKRNRWCKPAENNKMIKRVRMRLILTTCTAENVINITPTAPSTCHTCGGSTRVAKSTSVSNAAYVSLERKLWPIIQPYTKRNVVKSRLNYSRNNS